MPVTLVEIVLQKLEEANLFPNITKSAFAEKEGSDMSLRQRPYNP